MPFPDSDGRTRIALGSDHAGYRLKAYIAGLLTRHGYFVTDCGTDSEASADYPVFAGRVAEAVADGSADKGVVLCGTGIGVSIAANRYQSVRAALCTDEETAALARRHNDANVLALGARTLGKEEAGRIVASFLRNGFEGGRHERRIRMLEGGAEEHNPKGASMSANATRPQETGSRHETFFNGPLERRDPEIFGFVEGELKRQQDTIELIASENIASKAVLDAQGSVFTNKYAEGYPGKRYYGGCEHADHIERAAIERLCALFGCSYANVQPHSGSQANQAVLLALLAPGDTIMGQSLAAGGHLTHGTPVNLSGKWFNAVSYGVRKEDARIDYGQARELAQEHKPKLIIAGCSAYPRVIDWKKFADIAAECGAYLMVDMAHVAGLVAAGEYPSPLPHAHVVTSTTHKTLRGPRGGFIVSTQPDLVVRKTQSGADVTLASALNSAVFPGLQGGPLVHVIAAKAVSFREAAGPEFKAYAKQVVANAKALADVMKARGADVVSGGTDSHIVLVDLRPKGLTGKAAEEAMERAGLTCNKNAVPFDPEKPFVTSGVRLGTAAGTSRGFGLEEFRAIGGMIGDVLDALASGDDAKRSETEQRVRKQVSSLCAAFPIYGSPL
jgi:glycine hydroxymethyltransferase